MTASLICKEALVTLARLYSTDQEFIPGIQEMGAGREWHRVDYVGNPTGVDLDRDMAVLAKRLPPNARFLELEGRAGYDSAFHHYCGIGMRCVRALDPYWDEPLTRLEVLFEPPPVGFV